MSGGEMSHRSSDRVTKAGGNVLPRDSKGHRNRDDCLVTAVAGGGRVSAARAAAVIRGLSPLQREVARTVAMVRVASGRQLQRLHFGESTAAARRAGRTLKRLTDQRVLGRLPRQVGGVRAGSAGFVYRLDVVGQSLTAYGRGRRPWQVGSEFTAHGLLVAECYVRLVEVARESPIDLGEYRVEADAWWAFTGEHGATYLKPDALAVILNGPYEDRWWLEVDNDSENPGRIARKAEQYARAFRLGATGHEPFPKVLWVCTSEQRRRSVARGLRTLAAGDRQLFQTCTLDELADVVLTGPTVESFDEASRRQP
jgi:hypothetical protein